MPRASHQYSYCVWPCAAGRKFIQETKIREQLNILYDLIILILMLIVMVQNKILVFLILVFLTEACRRQGSEGGVN